MLNTHVGAADGTSAVKALIPHRSHDTPPRAPRRRRGDGYDKNGALGPTAAGAGALPRRRG
ncbi:hypothetical protein HMPREF9005_0793 [Actinomyces sp. oral taxon 178 str. F0338]|nr:hypothetical protein HMPREF9005_0793 [Actinomyces sp. oral taxon 178 str. F0338]